MQHHCFCEPPSRTIPLSLVTSKGVRHSHFAQSVIILNSDDCSPTPLRISHRFQGSTLMTRLLLALALCFAFASLADAQVFELKKGDHICIVGNTLADRMQHFGWLETLIHARYPQHELVFRNLGYSGDEIELNKRLRSMDFGTPDQWLAGSAPVPQPKKLNPNAPVQQNRFETTNTKADVIFAFFGYNESFAGEKGLPKFKQDVDGYLKHLL